MAHHARERQPDEYTEILCSRDLHPMHSQWAVGGGNVIEAGTLAYARLTAVREVGRAARRMHAEFLEGLAARLGVNLPPGGDADAQP